MNLPQVYMCSPSWTLLPPPSPFHPSGSSQCTQPQASSIVHRTWTGNSFHTWYFTCFNAILPNLPFVSFILCFYIVYGLIFYRETSDFYLVGFTVLFSLYGFWVSCLVRSTSQGYRKVSPFKIYLYSFSSFTSFCLKFILGVNIFFCMDTGLSQHQYFFKEYFFTH